MAAANPQHSKTCAACGGDLFQFEPPSSIKGIDSTALPAACRRCGQISVSGKPLRFPPAFQQKVAGIAEEAARQGQVAQRELIADPNLRVEKYFAEVYRTGFLHGFTRALAWFTHYGKEGRLTRLRRLWSSAEKNEISPLVEIRMQPTEFDEFNQLLAMSALAREEHAQGPSNLDRPR